MQMAVGRSPGSKVPCAFTPLLSLLLVVALLSGNVLAAIPIAAQEAESFATATVVPVDVVAYTVVPLQEDAAQWTQALALLERAGLGQELQQIRDEALGADDSELALELLLGGEVALVVTDVAIELLIQESAAGAMAPPGLATPEPYADLSAVGLAFVITSDAPGILAAGIEDAIADTAADVGSEVQQSEHAGVTIDFVEVPAGRVETPLAVARVDDFVLVGGYPADLEPLIETSQGERSSLAELDAFGEVQDVLGQDYLAFGFVNSFPSEAVQGALQASGLPGGVLAGQAPPTGYIVTATDLGFGLETVSLGGVTASAETGFPEPLVLSQTPDDVLLFLAASDLAGTGLLDVISVFLLSGAGFVGFPADAESLDEILDAQFEELARSIGVNLRTDLLRQLTGDYGFWLKLDPLSGAISALFASGLGDPATVSSALFQVTLLVQSAVSGQAAVTSRPVGDESRVFAVETGDPIVPLVEYGVVGEQLVVGLGDAVDNVGEGPETPLAENETFETIMSALPEPTSGIFYVDLLQAAPLLTNAASGAEVDALAPALNDVGTQGLNEATPAATPVNGDAHPDCGQFGSQADAQAAYDTFAPGSFNLDQDFDGEACEDFYSGSAAAAATPVTNPPAASSPQAGPMTPSPDELRSFTGFGMVAYEEDGNSRTSSLLLIEDVED